MSFNRVKTFKFLWNASPEAIDMVINQWLETTSFFSSPEHHTMTQDGEGNLVIQIGYIPSIEETISGSRGPLPLSRR